jgi:uncharacterized protein (DUF58 family)
MSLSSKLREKLKQRSSDDKEIIFKRDNLYIIPSSYCLGFITVCIVLYLIAVNYQNNLVYVALFWLLSLLILSIFKTHQNLNNSKWILKGFEEAFAGNPLTILMQVQSSVTNVQVTLNDCVKTVSSDGLLNFTLQAPTTTRGYHTLNRIKVESIYPFGLFRAFTYLHFTKPYLVYPAVNDLPLNTLNSQIAESEEGTNVKGAEEFAILKEYQAGDNIKQIHWKSFSKNEQLLIKEFSQNLSNDVFLDLNMQTGSLEQKISTITTAVVNLSAQNIAFGVILPNETIEVANGDNHKRAVLTKLALL